MEFRVDITAKAEGDVSAVLAWYCEQRAIQAGNKWLARLFAQIKTLETMPKRCALAAESNEIGREIHELNLGRRRGSYRLLFEIVGPTVYILRVRRGSQDRVLPEDL